MKRIECVDVLRGMTMAFMLIVDNPGGKVFTPLDHAPWNGMTPTDIIFPTFVFVMGVSMYLSLSRSSFRLSWKVLRRFLLIFGIGLLCNWISKGIFRGNWGLEGIRITGVLQRLALCYGISAVIVCLIPHKWLGWIISGTLVAYSALLLLGNGYIDGPENILLRADVAILGTDHLYGAAKGVDPEGLLSTLPAIAHTLIGFIAGKWLIGKDFRKMDSAATLMLAGGLILLWVLPLNKKVWSPSFVLVACGIATLLLSTFHYLIDEKGVWEHTGFWKVFGSNAITCFLLCDIVVWVMNATGWQAAIMRAIGNTPWTSLLYSLCGMIAVYLITLPLYRRKVFIRL